MKFDFIRMFIRADTLDFMAGRKNNTSPIWNWGARQRACPDDLADLMQSVTRTSTLPFSVSDSVRVPIPFPFIPPNLPVFDCSFLLR